MPKPDFVKPAWDPASVALIVVVPDAAAMVMIPAPEPMSVKVFPAAMETSLESSMRNDLMLMSSPREVLRFPATVAEKTTSIVEEGADVEAVEPAMLVDQLAAVVHRLDWFPLHQSEVKLVAALSLNVLPTVERLQVKSPGANEVSSNTQSEVNPPVPLAVMRFHERGLEGAAIRFSWIFPAPVREALPPTERKSAVSLSKSNRKALAFKLSDPEIVEFRVVPSARLSVARAVDAFKLAREVESALAPWKKIVPALIEIVPLFVLFPPRVSVPPPALARFPAPWIWPSKVVDELLASVSVWPDASTTEPPMAPPPDKVAAVWLAFTERVAPAIFPITRLAELPTALAPERTSEPLWTDTVPLKEFVPPRMVVPDPACRSVPFPEMPFAKSTPWVSVLER